MRPMRRDGLHAMRLRTMGMATRTMTMRRRCRWRRTWLPLCRQCDHRASDTRNGAHGRFRLRPHALPGAGLGGIHIDGEHHLAVRDGDFGQHICVHQRHATRRRHLGEAIQNLLFRNAQMKSPGRRKSDRRDKPIRASVYDEFEKTRPGSSELSARRADLPMDRPGFDRHRRCDAGSRAFQIARSEPCSQAG